MADQRVFVDLHCHTRASFDSLADPAAVVRAAARRGLTHLAITDHDRIDGALAAKEAAPPELTVIVGEEIKSADGDLVAVFLREAVPPGLSAQETITAVREQGGLVGIPHPFDRRAFGRKSGAQLEDIAGKVDWIEAYNARAASLPDLRRLMTGAASANEEAARFAVDHKLPGLAASDAHTVMEVGVAYNVMTGDPGTPAGLLAALKNVDMITSRASFYVRLWTPVAKVVQSLRGNGRRPPESMRESR